MYEVHTSIVIAAEPGAVFEALSDHEAFLVDDAIDRCVLESPGSPDRNGLGAVRVVTAGAYRLTEEIVAFDPPRRYDYVIREVTRKGRPAPLEHERGWLELTPVESGTRVDWHSRFRFAIPVIGWFAERVQGPGLRRSFARMLARAKDRLEAVPTG